MPTTDPREDETPSRDSPQTPEGRLTREGRFIVAAMLYWGSVWLGTALAGGAFGLLVGCLPGLLFGPIIAGFVAVPILVTVGTLAWSLWLSRFRVAVGGLAGGLTGVVATVPGVDVWPSSLFFWVYAGGAGLIGTVGGATGAALYCRAAKRQRNASDAPGREVWQFTLLDLFVRITVLAMLIGGWTSYFQSAQRARLDASYPTDRWLTEHFEFHREEFDDFVVMLEDDKDNGIDNMSEGLVDLSNASDEYQARMRRAGIWIIDSDLDKSPPEVRFCLHHSIEWPLLKGLAYTTEPPECVDGTLDDVFAGTLPVGARIYRRIDKNWYIYVENVENGFD